MANRTPSYRLHKPSGQAVVTLGGKDHYLGAHGTEASKKAYDSLIARWTAGDRRLPEARVTTATINEVCLKFWNHAQRYYRKHDRKTSRLGTVRNAMQPLARLYGEEPLAEFGPSKFKTVRQVWVDAGLCRDTINHYAGMVKQIVDWAVSEEMIEGSASHALRAVPGLVAGRTTAIDYEPVGPVPGDVIEKTVERLGPRFAAMVQLQLATGMRPGEVCRVRPCDLDRSGPVWTYTPGEHKTEHHGHRRSVAIGPKGQAILGPMLDGVAPERYLFHLTGNRPLNLNSLRKTIGLACRKAGVPHWTANQLRHNYATMIRHALGLEAAQIMLGHENADTTQIYAELDRERAAEIAAKFG